MADPARIASLTTALLDAVASNDARVAWRTLSGEAAARGFSSSRAFRDFCYRAGISIRDVAGVALVAVAEVDRAGLDAPARPVPLSARPDSAVDAENERDAALKELRALKRAAKAAGVKLTKPKRRTGKAGR